MKILLEKVVCYEGYRRNERPLYFYLKGKKIKIKNVIKSWAEPEKNWFYLVETESKRYLLNFDEKNDNWFLIENP